MRPAETTSDAAQSPAVAATCGRCGAFARPAELQIIAGELLCGACVSRQLTQLPSLQERAAIARWLLVATAAMNAVLALAQSASQAARAPLVAIAIGFVALGLLASLVLSAVFFCRWFHLAVRHANARGINVGTTPAGAVGSWFIPFLNLVRPFEYTTKLLGERGDSSNVVRPWQTAWIVGGVVTNLSSRMDSTALSLGGMAIEIVAAYFAIRVVGEVTRRLSPSAT